MKLLVTGARGLVGSDLVRLGAARGLDVVACSRGDLDVTDARAVAAVLARHRPDGVVNCAAFTDVDAAEDREAAALAVNGEGARNVARAARDLGARLVHISTDYVFAGGLERPLLEGDPLGPLGAYGRSKLKGEHAVQEVGGPCLVVRTSWIYGTHGRNFVDTVRKRVEGASPEPLRVVADQAGSPTWSVCLGNGILDLLEARAQGVVHFACRGEVSWHGLAVAILEELGLEPRVEPIRSRDLDRKAARPAYSVLSTALFEKLVGRAPLGWRAALRLYLRGAAEETAGAGGCAERP